MREESYPRASRRCREDVEVESSVKSEFGELAREKCLNSCSATFLNSDGLCSDDG
jgi:hypothetical protein